MDELSLKTLLEIKEGMGRVEANTENLEKHITAVSQKVDNRHLEQTRALEALRQDFDVHKLKTDAHGIKAVREAAAEGRAAGADWRGWVAIGISLIIPGLALIKYATEALAK